MRKPFKLGVVLGRFQHLHDGHNFVINTALTNCKKVLLLVGSSQESGTARNPFTLYTRMNLIREAYSGEVGDGSLLLAHIDDLSSEDDIADYRWGDFVLNKVDMWRGHYNLTEKVDCMIYGSDEKREKWYRPESLEGIAKIIIPRNNLSISATAMREFLANNCHEKWKLGMDELMLDSKARFASLRKELLETPYYRDMWEEKCL